MAFKPEAVGNKAIAYSTKKNTAQTMLHKSYKKQSFDTKTLLLELLVIEHINLIFHAFMDIYIICYTVYFMH